MDEVSIRPLGEPGDLGWVVMTHGEVYAREFGWDISFEALVSRIVADYVEDGTSLPRGAWIAQLGPARVGCVFCVPADATTAKLRILLVDPQARGHGVGRALVDTCVAFAREARYRRVVLWTNDVLSAARRIYLERGFVRTSVDPHHSFGVDLVGETYELALQPDPGVPGTTSL